MTDFRFRINGLNKNHLRRWRRIPRARGGSLTLFGSSVIGWVAVVLVVVYTVKEPTSIIPDHPAVVHSVSTAPDTPVSVCTPTILFLNQTFVGTADFEISAVDSKERKISLSDKAQLITLESKRGTPILVLAPTRAYPAQATIKGEIWQKDPSGYKTTVAEIAFKTRNYKLIDAETINKLEQHKELLVGLGDIGLIIEAGDIKPRDRTKMVGLSTGKVFGQGAEQEKASLLVLGPIRVGTTRATLKFNYDFISSEFDEFVGKIYDDAFVVVVSGPKGAVAKLISSVDIVGKKNSTPVKFKDSFNSNILHVEHSGWQPVSISANVGSPACVSFLVTDVGDYQYTTAVTIDSLRIE